MPHPMSEQDLKEEHERLEAASFDEMDRETWSRLEDTHKSLLNGMGSIEKVQLDGFISQEDMQATQRVLRAITLYMNQYRDVKQHGEAKDTAREIAEVEKRLASLKGTSTKQ